MKTIIAIKGHITRGDEVIKILEMLGGINTYKYDGSNESLCYYIGATNNIIYCNYIPNIYPNIYKCIDYTLEEFLEKYPYKVGDKVYNIIHNENQTITNLSWDFQENEVVYQTDNNEYVYVNYLQPYKETMNTKIAIKGHKTRGKEVIEILEMLGGKNEQGICGNNPNVAYYISHENTIVCDWCINGYTLEEFLEKYPYKVGNKVQHKGATYCDTIYEVDKIRWVDDHVEYTVKHFWYNNCYNKMTVKDLQPYKEYKEENMEERKYSDLRLDVDQDDKLSTEVTIDGDKITPPENYLIGKVTTVDNGLLVEFVKKRPQLPKTYEECCKVLGIDPDNFLSIRNLYRDDGEEETTDYESDLLEKFDHLRELTICRKAYWKIAGEQMGLDKPWKPDWLDTNTQKYCIYYVGDEIKKQPMLEVHHFLAFPTKEMSDEFFENFKELIESCEEFL